MPSQCGLKPFLLKWKETPKWQSGILKQVIPRFGMAQTLQSVNGLAFVSHVTQGVTPALGIKYHLYSDWRPQSSSKVEKGQSNNRTNLD
jgi:hypothetical protein